MLKLSLQKFAEEEQEQSHQPEEIPPAEAKNTEPNEDSGEEKKDEQRIPYSRFKEVNDALKRYKELGFDSPEKVKELADKLAEYEKAEEERKKAEMSELERLQAEKEEYANKAKEFETKAEEALRKANERLMRAEFKVIAKEAGVHPEALEDAFKLADLSGVEIDDEGNVIGLDDAIKALKESKKYLFANRQVGADPSPGAGAPRRDSHADLRQQIKEAEEIALKSNKFEDRLKVMQLRAQLDD